MGKNRVPKQEEAVDGVEAKPTGNRQKVPVISATYREFAEQLKLLSGKFAAIADRMETRKDNQPLTVTHFEGSAKGLNSLEDLASVSKDELDGTGETPYDRIKKINITC